MISPISERSGQELHNQLRNRFNPLGQPADPLYVLSMKVIESIKKLGVRSDATATRANLTVRVLFKLRRTSDRKVVFKGTSSSTNSYDILDLEIQVSTEAAEQDARARGLQEVAAAMKTRIALYLRSQSG